jgi:hypothetical protein
MTCKILHGRCESGQQSGGELNRLNRPLPVQQGLSVVSRNTSYVIVVDDVKIFVNRAVYLPTKRGTRNESHVRVQKDGTDGAEDRRFPQNSFTSTRTKIVQQSEPPHQASLIEVTMQSLRGHSWSPNAAKGITSTFLCINQKGNPINSSSPKG